MKKTFETRAVTDSDRTSTFIVSTNQVDRDGDVIDPTGWQLDNFRRNPVILLSHDYSQPPIARATQIWATPTDLRASIEFPPQGVYPLADVICNMVKSGFLNATSVGFKPLAMEPNAHGGHTITAAELLEISVVGIPSNPSALVLQRGVADSVQFKSWLRQETEGPMAFDKRVTGCPRGKHCPNTTNTIHCPGVDDPPDPATGDSGGCPFLVSHYSRAFAEAFIKVATTTVATAAAKELLAATPGTTQHLNTKLEEREASKKQQDKMAGLLRWERQKRMERVLLGGGQVKRRPAPELKGYLADQECWWLEGEPIASLGVF